MNPEGESIPVALGLGSNLGESRRNLQLAASFLESVVHELRLSSFIVTAPIQCRSGAPSFLNAAAVGRTSLPPHALLDACQAIEMKMGRPGNRARDVELYGDRVIDIDILLYGGLSLADKRLILPHPHLRERRFVLAPLAELAPEWRIPPHGETVAEALARVG